MTDFKATRQLFQIPDGMTYLVGNSLGPMPHTAQTRVENLMKRDWANQIVGGWRSGGENKQGWFVQPGQIGDRIGKLIGAPAGSTIVGDTLSLKVYQALGAALAMRPDRKIILSDAGNFPTDLYMVQSLIKSLRQGHELKIVGPHKIAEHLNEQVAALLITEVDYRTSQLHSMKDLTAKAHKVGALTVWDLAHSAGALPIDVTETQADFAVGCTYKFLNGGPGAPAFIYVAPKHLSQTEPLLAGWMGHAQPFDFDTEYKPSPTIERMRVGTPPVLGMAALDGALDVWDQVELSDIRTKTIELGQMLVELIGEKRPQLKLESPVDPHKRGSHLAFSHPNGYAIVQALIADKIMADFRAPDTIRFAITPLYIGAEDLAYAVDKLAHILASDSWDKPQFMAMGKVT
ncbi:MAG: kynureninase [Alphaproteobacteria bacterium]